MSHLSKVPVILGVHGACWAFWNIQDLKSISVWVEQLTEDFKLKQECGSDLRFPPPGPFHPVPARWSLPPPRQPPVGPREPGSRPLLGV